MNRFSVKIYLAPLRGVTLRTYRNAFRRHFEGVDVAVSPFIPTVNGSGVKPSLLKDVDLEREQLIPVIPQIIGNRPEDVLNMCKALRAMGHKEINWNLGCPHRPVTRKKRGSGLLPHPEMIKAVLDLVFNEVDVCFSVKARLGLNEPDELYKIAGLLNNYPLKEITIHPRTGSQMYDGTVDLDMFEKCLGRFECPVVYNGDIVSAGDFEKLQKRFPAVKGWMLGRGLIANPFLAEEIKGVSREERNRKERVVAFLEDVFSVYCEELYGPAHILGRMKELWRYMALSFDGGSDMLRMIKRSTSVDEYRKLVDEFLKEERVGGKKSV